MVALHCIALLLPLLLGHLPGHLRNWHFLPCQRRVPYWVLQKQRHSFEQCVASDFSLGVIIHSCCKAFWNCSCNQMLLALCMLWDALQWDCDMLSRHLTTWLLYCSNKCRSTVLCFFFLAPSWEPEGNAINPLTKKIGSRWCLNASQESMNHLPGNQWVERWNISQRDGFHSLHSRRFLLSALQVRTWQVLSAAGVVQR